MKKRHLIVALSLLLAAVLCVSGFVIAAQPKQVVVYYTNDVHTYIDNYTEEEPGLSYSLVASLKDSTKNSILVDAGDHLQGTAYGGMDNGASIIQIMNATGYDAATLGNHEFDYGMDGCTAAISAADYPYTSCNFRYETDGVSGETVLDPFVMVKKGRTKIAFVGITTPETITASAPAYFQDDNGNYVYGIDGGSDGSELYAAAQQAIDEALSAGADYVIALGHLGVDVSSDPWTSRNLIANTTGLDAFIDGHSHTSIVMETVADKEGNSVVLSQTGSYLGAVGKMTISPDGIIAAEHLYAEDIADLTPDPEVAELEESWITEVTTLLGEVIGYSDITFDNYDAEGNRLVRRQSTNSGDFAADALYFLFDDMGMDVDAAIMNGGGIRNQALTGELTYLSCKEIHTFGNVACLLRVTGQQILDALEWGSKGITADGSGENGSFLHVSGLKYTLDLTRESSVQADEKDVWTGPPTDGYRVSDVMILNRETGEYEPLDLNAEYNLAGYNYTLRDLGGGFAMLDGAVNVLDYVAEDYMVLANYIRSFPVSGSTGLPTITENSGYGNVNGSGRITIIS